MTFKQQKNIKRFLPKKNIFTAISLSVLGSVSVYGMDEQNQHHHSLAVEQQLGQPPLTVEQQLDQLGQPPLLIEQQLDQINIFGLVNSFFTHKADLNDYDSVVNALMTIPPGNHLGLIVGHAKKLIIPGMRGAECASIIKAVVRIDPEGCRDAVIKSAQQLIPPGMRGAEPASIVEEMRKASSKDRRDAVIESARQLIPQSMGGAERVSIIKELRGIPSRDHKAVTAYANQLITSGMRGDERVSIIKEVRNIPPENRHHIVKENARRLIVPGMNGQKRVQLIGTLRTLGKDIDQHVQRVIKYIDFPPNDDTYFDRIIEILTTPLNQNIPKLSNDPMQRVAIRSGYKKGIDVHNRERESQTEKAINALKEHQKEVEQKDIKAAYNSFLTALNALPDDAKKTRIMQVIGMKEVPAVNHFKGFLKGRALQCLEGMTSEEFLGRLWFFTDKMDDKTETENAQAAFFSSLSNCVLKNGTVLCDSGKIQHMIVGVLQGRLEGVTIDGSVVEAADDAKVVILDADIKQTMDALMLEAIQTEGRVNCEKVLRLINPDGRLSQAQIDACKKYILSRSEQIDALKLIPVFTTQYRTKGLMENALKKFLADDPNIANDPLLKAVLQCLMEETLEISIEEHFAEFEMLEDNIKLDLATEEGRGAFVKNALKYCKEHPNISMQSFLELVEEALDNV